MAPVPGPILAHEGRASARRWQTYGLRASCAALLLLGLAVIWFVQVAGKPQGPVRGQPEVGRRYFCVMVGVQLALVLLAAPAFSAGSICEDRIKGVLPHVLVTDLRSGEIVLEKLAASLASVLGLVASVVPVAYVVSWLGGIDPMDLVWAFAIAAAVGVLGSALALTFSIWARSAHEALLGVYAVWALSLMVYPAWNALSVNGGLVPPPTWIRATNPFWLSFACELEPDLVGSSDYLAFLAVTLAVSAALPVLSIARLRPVTVALAAGLDPRRRVPTRLSLLGRLLRAVPGPSLDGNPVLWREWHRARIPGRARTLWQLLVVAYSTVACLCAFEVLRNGVAPGPNLAGAGTVILLVVGLLMLSASATASLSEERMRGSLEVLLATPLSTREIIWGKWLGAFRGFAVMAFWPAIVVAALAFAWRRPFSFTTGSGLVTNPRPSITTGAFSVALIASYVLAHGAMISSLGLALATWIPRQGRAAALCAAYFVAVGLGWPLLCFMLLDDAWPEYTATYTAMLSPFIGFLQLAEFASGPGIGNDGTPGWLTFWTLALFGGASALLVAIRVSFDRCLGRITDGPTEGNL